MSLFASRDRNGSERDKSESVGGTVGSFIVRPEWQFILPARRTEGTSPSDINDAASRGGSSSEFYRVRQKGRKKEANLPSPCKRRRRL